MKAVVIYKSKTGFAKKYAQWIAEDLSTDIFDASKVNINMLTAYDTIIYGGSLYAGGINGIKLIKQNIDKLKDKKIVVFATGASPSREDVINKVFNRNFTVEQQKYIKFFYLRGGFNFSRLSSFDKFIMTILKWQMKRKKKEELTPDEADMLAAYDKPVDYTSRDNITKIIDCIKR